MTKAHVPVSAAEILSTGPYFAALLPECEDTFERLVQDTLRQEYEEGQVVFLVMCLVFGYGDTVAHGTMLRGTKEWAEAKVISCSTTKFESASTGAMSSANVSPAVNIIYPLTNHAFDLLLPQVLPPAHAALYYLERFLTLMV